jgi:branched-chain amino acid transport system permease protein
MRNRFLWSVLATLALLLSACAGGLDADQLDVCRRVLPALHPDGTELREIRFGAPAPGRIRIDYAAREPGGANRAHYAICVFAGVGFDKDRLELTGVETDGSALGIARLFYLKRYWLAPLAAGAELTTLPPPVPAIPRAMAYALQHLIGALALAATYGLLATAYSLIYGLVGRINLAFGELAIVGSFAAIGGVAVAAILGAGDNVFGGLATALLCAAATSSLWSWALGERVVAPLHARHRHGQPILVATAAAAVAIQEFLRLFQGVRERWLPPFFSGPIPLAHAGQFVVTVSAIQLIVAGAAIVAAVAMLWLLARTALGRQWRAFADDPIAASMLGVSPARILGVTFLLSGLNAGLAGWIVAVYYGNVSASFGTMLGLKALLAAIVGGIGSIEGALIGGVLIGLIEAAWSAYFDIGMRDVFIFSLLVVVFLLRPGGLFGFSGPSPREV